ncbi:Hypothetical_protein [Hexamita inflata]|uniref:Hypothetical_protein n=1 Tax=Hexamita inflata TaxID=28002 RepID=A0AA86RGJ2_9EUKA|nr:Hypothetical protein HINF_LOCUS13211 [Hexamita inflata]CAI9966710.1 Hypothetical protein HINF_LOCUS54355 [Hexamita inflata]
MQTSTLQLEMYQVHQFAVFGFNNFKQKTIDSEIFVKINYTVLTGALLCFECDIIVINTNLQFSARGLQLSALIFRSKDIIQLENVNISYRFSSNASSGIVNQILTNILQFTLNDIIIIGFNDIESQLNGYYFSRVESDFSIEQNQVVVCVDLETRRIGKTQKSIYITNQEVLQCNSVCQDNQYVTYGICQEQIKFSILLSNNTVICDFPFAYDQQSDSCICKYGYYLNISVCVNVIDYFSQIVINMSLVDKKLHGEIQSSSIELKSLFYNLEMEIQSNISNLSQLVFETYTDVKNDIQTTNFTLHSDITYIQNQMYLKFQQASEQNQQTQSIMNGFQNENQNKLNNLSSLINNVQADISNQFVTTQNQITDLKSYVGTNFDQVDTSISAINSQNQQIVTQLNSIQGLINENEKYSKNNFTQTQALITDLKSYVGTQITQSVANTNTGIGNLQATLNSMNSVIQSMKSKIDSMGSGSSGSMTSQQYNCLMTATVNKMYNGYYCAYTQQA